MGDLRSNHPELFETGYEHYEKCCPECSSKNIQTERSPNGYTRCMECKRVRLHREFYKILTNEEAGNMSLDELSFPCEVLYSDDYGKTITEYYNYIEAKGGDGTLLKAINKFRHLNKPFFGVAAGTLNFLMNPEDGISDSAKYKRFNLIKVKITTNTNEEDIDYDGKNTLEYQAFNDVLFGGDMNTWATFNVHDKDKIVGQFQGGGLGICTAQGSTGFNKNNGGAILPLSSDQWFLTNAFSGRKIRVPLEPKRTSITAESRTQLKVWIDGQNHIIDNVQKIEISKGNEVQVIFNDYDEFKRKRRV